MIAHSQSTTSREYSCGKGDVFNKCDFECYTGGSDWADPLTEVPRTGVAVSIRLHNFVATDALYDSHCCGDVAQFPSHGSGLDCGKMGIYLGVVGCGLYSIVRY